MSYSDEHYSGSQIAYDGALLPFEDAAARIERDQELQVKYEEAEKNVDDLQMTWDDVEAKLSKPMHDTRAGNMSSYGPGGSL